jgi:alanine-alpha-ketoisovalerate/valine-pyruvate aminotransferase
MKIKNRNSVSDDLNKYDYLATKDSFIQITEWSNKEGWDITINDNTISLTSGQLEAINYLIKVLEYNDK